MKRLMSSLLCSIMVATTLSGCGSSESTKTEDNKVSSGTESQENGAGNASGEANEPVNLTFWSMAERKELEDAVIAAFQEKYPNITVSPTYYSTDDLKTNMKIAASSDSLPDMWYNWGGSLASYYPENGLTYDFTEYAKENNWNEKFSAAALELCTLEGQLSGIPQSIAMMNVWYRKDIFEQCGIEVPKTFEELEKACEVLKDNGIVPFATGGQYGWHVMRYIQDLLEYYAGKEEHDALGIMDANWGTSEAVTKAFAKFKEWSDKGYFNEGYLQEDPNDCRMYVFNGTCAMTIDSPTFSRQLMQNEQDMSLYDYFVFPTETNEDGTGRMAAYVKMTQVNKNVTDAQLDAIMKFWDFYYNMEENPKYDSVEQPVARLDAKLPESYAIAEGAMEMMDACGIYTQTDQALVPEVADQLFAAQDGVSTGDVSPEEAGALVQTAIDTYKAAH